MAPRFSWPLVLILLGILLLAAPVPIFQAEVGAPTWEYGAVEIEVQDGDVQFPDPLAVPGPVYIEDIVCTDQTRSCALERHVDDQGEIRVDEMDFVRTPYEYVLIDGEIRAVDAASGDGTMTLSHEPVEARTALRRSSAAYDRAHPTYRAVIEEGEATSNLWIETPRVITKNPQSADEQFFYVYEISSPSPGQYERTVGQRILPWFLSIVSFVSGLGLLIYGQRMRLRRESWYQTMN